jgi:hypothetical protein
MTSKRFLSTAVLLSGVALISFATVARAGFEWKGPIEPPVAAPGAMVIDDGMADLAPVTSDSMPAPAVMPAPVENQTLAAAPASAPVAAAPAMEGDALAGFGSDVPLVMALQQIVPAGYQYSFANGVNPGVSVSWQGGRPWQAVLSEALARHGLSYTMQNNAVVIDIAANGPIPAVSPAPMMMPEAAPAAAPSDSSADGSAMPLNIVSQPPADSASADGMSEMPKDDPVADNTPAVEEGAAVAAKPAEEVTIRREKKSLSLLERLGWKRKKPAPAAEAAAEAAPTEERTAAISAPPVMTDAPAEEPKPVAATAAASGWQGAKGQTLRDVLKGWSDKAGVELYWSIDYDYRLNDDVAFPGEYNEAVGSLLDKFAAVRPQPYGQLHQGSQGPKVLVIKSYDLTP